MPEPVKPQLHYSHLSMFTRCGEQYRRRYLEGIIIAPGMALHVGVGTHASVELNLKAKLATGALLPQDAVQDAARDGVVKSIEASGVTLDADEKAAGLKAAQGAAVDMAVALSIVHHLQVAPKVNPAHIERPWVLELRGSKYDLAGRIDIQETGEAATPGTIRDTKTCARSPAAGDADSKDQLTMYALAALTLDGAIPPLVMDYLVKTKVPKAVTQSTVRTQEDLGVLLRRIEVMISAIQHGVFVPASQENWWCSPRWCGYFDSCPYARKRIVVPVAGE